MHSRSTPHRSKCVSYVLRCALARRPPTQMRFRCAQLCFRSTPVSPNAIPMCSYATCSALLGELERGAFKQISNKPTTELSLAERSEAHRAKRGAARSAAAAEGGRRRRRPRAARGLQTKARMRPHWQRLLSWRINSLGRRESVLCTYGILDS